ncbi:hypothetical protein JMM81_15780 [Bacillus sp. V3B]|uniref:hypothetical protein n=1 Tax=Bacillus sp. V3B TaxID=2804915 RepID=UPI00210E3CE2|nr:hypothetical protein [Bacillus sp. V3B]MCQ6276375.1 hypothetical protein [Bacillus sp. V3B]
MRDYDSITFENHFKKDVKLPFKVPSIPFTHYFGRFNDLEGNLNDSLDIEFINEKSSEYHYKLDIRQLKYKINFKNEKNHTTYTLENGQKVIYFEHQYFNFFVFEHDNWQYILSVSKRVLDTVTPETFIEIANSIDYVPEKGSS